LLRDEGEGRRKSFWRAMHRPSSTVRVGRCGASH
jgi:hypothetical protein